MTHWRAGRAWPGFAAAQARRAARLAGALAQVFDRLLASGRA